jgi:hypothetical protein
VFGDGVTVGGTRKQRSEDEDVERALQQFYARWRFEAHCVGILLYILQSVYRELALAVRKRRL